MKNLRKAELAVIGATLLVLSFTAGYFTGRNSGAHVISFEQLSDPPGVTASAASSVPASQGASPSASGAYAASSFPSITIPDKLDINSATLSELDALPGIGSVLAGRIIDYRQKSGGFSSIYELQNVDGIGDKKFEAIKDMITV